MENDRIAIIIATYWKLDGSTAAHLENTLRSVAAQTSQKYKVFLIGDKYAREEELLGLSRIIDADKLYVENLPVAVEREIYSGRDLWACGGSNATRVGTEKALSEGFKYIAELNHDDVYLPHHVEIVLRTFREMETNLVVTKCNFLPDVETELYYTPYRPLPNKQFLASVCYNHEHYPAFRRTPEELRRKYGFIYAGDADKWNQINEIMIERGEYGIFVNNLTCRKIGGKDPINRPWIVK